MDDVQTKDMAQVRLEEDKRRDDDKYYHLSRKITTSRVRDYKPYSKNAIEEPRVNATQEYAHWRKDPNLPPTWDSYGFTITHAAMIREFTKMGDIVKWPPKSNKPKFNPDSNIWCDYHGDYEHKSYDYIALKKELQFLVKKGYLSEFIHNDKFTNVRRDRTPTRRNRTPPRQSPPPPHLNIINFIAGGSEICGATYSQAKRTVRETGLRVARVVIKDNKTPKLMFDESDREFVIEPQHASLVISLPMGNCLIKRILVDNSSVVNIMMLNTLQQMGLAESDMVKRSTTLVGFSSETKKTIGKISLLTYAHGLNFERISS